MSLTSSTLLAATSDGQLGAAQQVGDLLVARAHAGAGVDDEHRDLRVGERGLRLLADRAGDRVEVALVHAAGVDEREAPPVPLGGDLVAVARHARALVHDGRARARQAVDERGLADVGIADDGDLHAALRGQRDDALDDLVEAQARSCRARRRPAPAAAASARASGRARRGSRCSARIALVVGAELLRAAARALLRRGGEEDLQLAPGARRRCRCRGPRRRGRRRR